MILTARDLIRKLAKETGIPYSEIANRVNAAMNTGASFLSAVEELAEEYNLASEDFSIDPLKIVNAISQILKKDYSQTLMISAVLSQMVESKGTEQYPPPAFFAFMDILSQTEGLPMKPKEGIPDNIEEVTTRIIELTTTLVSIICEWSIEGIVGVAKNCSSELVPLARNIVRKTRLYQAGMWICISCGKIIDLQDACSLLCSSCDSELQTYALSRSNSSTDSELDHIGFDRTTPRKNG